MKRYPFGKFILDIPDDHKIIEIHHGAALYDRAFGLMLEEIQRANPTGTIFDIGGNIGDTAAFIATYVSNPIVSVEGSPVYTEYFKSNQRHFGRQVSLIDKFVRTEALSKMSLTYGGKEGSGALKVSTSDKLDDEKFVTVDELIRSVKSNIALVKSDTDGFDGYIINDFLAKAKVPLFFECDTLAIPPGLPNPWPELFSKLQAGKYSIIVFDNFGLPMFVEGENPERILKDLAGYVHLQRSVHPVRIHYFDIWAFPPSSKDAFNRAAARLRSDLLKPFGF